MNTEIYKQKLEEERDFILKQLQEQAVKNPHAEEDWIPDVKEVGNETSSIDEVSQKHTDEQSNTGIVNDLEVRFANVKKALEKIENGSFGICEVSGTPIEKERLDANPAARTCLEHKDTDLPVF